MLSDLEKSVQSCHSFRRSNMLVSRRSFGSHGERSEPWSFPGRTDAHASPKALSLASFCRETRKCPPDAYSAPEGAVDCSPGCSVAKPWVNQQHTEPALEGRWNFGWIPRSSAVFRRPARA